MEKVKKLFKNKKFVTGFVVGMVILIAAAGIAYYNLSDKPISVETAKVETGTIKQYYDTTGVLTSGSSEKYYLYEGVKVKDVKVKTGDSVTKGDLLATFDTSSMNSVISEKRDAVNTAQKNYDDAVAGKRDTAARAAELDTRIKDLETQRDALAASEGTSGTTGTTGNTGTQLTEEQIEAIIAAAGNSGTAMTEEQIAALRAQLQNASQNTASGTSGTQALDAQISMLESEKSMINTGQYDSVIKAYEQTLAAAKEDYNNSVSEKKALDSGWTATGDGKVADVHITSGEPYVYVEDVSESNDIMSLLTGSGSELSSPELSEMLSGMMGGSDTTAKQGVGLVVDYFDGYKISFSLGKYDAQTIEVGMSALVEYTDYEYEAAVTYMSPHAENSTSAITSMMGGSSTTSSSALPAEATITNPDENLILGFDAKLSILTGEKKDVLCIPVESLVIEEGKKYVYILDEATQTVVKTEVETGISSETHYEVTSGLTEGDIVIVNSSKVTDGALVSVEK